jgi:hypothetical protein
MCEWDDSHTNTPVSIHPNAVWATGLAATQKGQNKARIATNFPHTHGPWLLFLKSSMCALTIDEEFSLPSRRVGKFQGTSYNSHSTPEIRDDRCRT